MAEKHRETDATENVTNDSMLPWRIARVGGGENLKTPKMPSQGKTNSPGDRLELYLQ
jgi:hypothetical protein